MLKRYTDYGFPELFRL